MAVKRINTALDATYVRCRTYGHGWDEFMPIDLDSPAYGWRLSLRCIRCATERHDNIDFKGRVMSRRYIYPGGYAQKGVTRVEFREALFVKLRTKLAASNSLGADSPVAPRKCKASVG